MAGERGGGGGGGGGGESTNDVDGSPADPDPAGVKGQLSRWLICIPSSVGALLLLLLRQDGGRKKKWADAGRRRQVRVGHPLAISHAQ